jgi:hypothetical protein
MAAAPSGNGAPAAAPTAKTSPPFDGPDYLYLLLLFMPMIVGLALWRILLESTRYVRTLTSLNNPTQRFFASPDHLFAAFKKSVLYAPIFSKRHNREFQLSAAVNMGTLPTRFQLLFLLAYFGINVAYCVVGVSFSSGIAVFGPQLRNKSGVISVFNMVPLFIMAGRNNLLINWLAISFDSFNLLHRWFGRIVVLEAVVHAVAWIATQASANGWSAVITAFSVPKLMFGLIVSLLQPCVGNRADV